MSMSRPAPTAIALTEEPRLMQFSVPAIRCAACIGTIERHFATMPGVLDARVNVTKKRVSIRADLPAQTCRDALKSLGFDARLLETAALAEEVDPVGRDILLRMGVAGFAMMNVMLLSVAVWSGATDATRDLFHLISAMIAAPAVLFSARPFFDHAWGALRGGRLNMDVPISLAIILAAGMSLYESLHGGAHAYFDAALSLTFFLLIGRYLEHRTRSAARSAAGEIAALEEQRADRKSGGAVTSVAIKDLAIGDRIVVSAGLRVPVDGTLDTAEAFTDRAFLTGESEPVHHARGAPLCAGEINLGAPFEMIATAIGADTRLARIARLVETAENARNSYTSLADKAAQIYAPAVHVLAALTFAGWMLIDADLRHALNVAIAVLIITCPCALGLAVPAVTTAAISRFFRMGFLVKSATALERLAAVSTMVFDKTGTLTEPGFSFALGTLTTEQRAVAKGLAECSSHPLSRSLARYLHATPSAPLSDVREHPGRGISGVWQGEKVALGRASWLGGTSDGLTLAMGTHVSPLASEERIRSGADHLITDLAREGIDCEIVSGDCEAKTALAARRLGCARWTSAVTPEGKVGHIQRRAETQPVCMIGDGINDTAALAQASVSIAPGSALDATRNAADIIILSETLKDLPTIVRVARQSIRLSKQNFGIAVIYNLIAVPIAMAGFATPLLAALTMSASSVTVLLNALRVRNSR